jgi:hypothetical protein
MGNPKSLHFHRDCGQKFWLIKFTLILIVDTTNATNYWKYIEFRMKKLSTKLWKQINTSRLLILRDEVQTVGFTQRRKEIKIITRRRRRQKKLNWVNPCEIYKHYTPFPPNLIKRIQKGLDNFKYLLSSHVFFAGDVSFFNTFFVRLGYSCTDF